ncbi:MAG: DUF1080 domain-containing protein [Planctomycetes bacterium]|nr:DUF1080 domain-containing protein [Planctomycetota bacterium]
MGNVSDWKMGVLVVVGMMLVGCAGVREEGAESGVGSLFDGKGLGLWKITEFGGEGEVSVKEGAIVMEMGNDMTGITWSGEVVRMNYEIELEAKRVAGHDFFCGLTFPVRDASCSLVAGGWGGMVVGLSTVDYYDASENETATVMHFETGQWYRFKVRVTEEKIEAWIDEEKVVDLETKGRDIDVRSEMDLSKPLGIACWQTSAAVRGIVVRRIN